MGLGENGEDVEDDSDEDVDEDDNGYDDEDVEDDGDVVDDNKDACPGDDKLINNFTHKENAMKRK